MPEASLAFFSVQRLLESSHPKWMAFAVRDESPAALCPGIKSILCFDLRFEASLVPALITATFVTQVLPSPSSEWREVGDQ